MAGAANVDRTFSDLADFAFTTEPFDVGHSGNTDRDGQKNDRDKHHLDAASEEIAEYLHLRT
jgi:hypothetical protein